MPSKPANSPYVLPESPTQLCTSCHLPTSSPIACSQPPPTPNQYSQCPSYTPHANRHNTVGYPYPQDAVHTSPSRRPTLQSTDHANNRYQARRSNVPGQHNNYNNVVQHHALLHCQCLVSGSLDDIPISVLIDTGSSIRLLDERLHYLLPSIPPLQPAQFSVSGADDRPLIVLSMATLSIAINNNTFRVQLVFTRNILFPVVLGINFLQTHDGIISFPKNQLYLTNSPPKPAGLPINANLIHNTCAPPMNTFTPYHPHSHITIPPDQPYHVINTGQVTIPPRTNTIMTIPCTLPLSGNYLFEPSQQHFVDHPVQYTPVIINAANDNLPVHFINHSDHEIVIPKAQLCWSYGKSSRVRPTHSTYQHFPRTS